MLEIVDGVVSAPMWTYPTQRREENMIAQFSTTIKNWIKDYIKLNPVAVLLTIT